MSLKNDIFRKKKKKFLITIIPACLREIMQALKS